MQEVSERYRRLISQPNHRFEISLVIGESGRLITERAETILFGGIAILVATAAADTGFREESLYSITTSDTVFSGSVPEVGAVISGEIDIDMVKPVAEIPRRARLVPYVRVTDGTDCSEWIQQGVFFVDTKSVTANDTGAEHLYIHGYDAIVMLEETYPSDSSHSYPLLDKTMVQFIADSIGVAVDERTWDIMTDGYLFPLPAGYSSREVLGMIASAYAGSFIMTELGELRLVQINEMPKETRLLIDHAGYRITFGLDDEEVRIVV